MIELFIKGGLVMYPILALALVGIAIIIERILFFFITGINYQVFRNELIAKMSLQSLADIRLRRDTVPSFRDFKNWLFVQRWNRSPYVKIAETYIGNIVKGARSQEEALRRNGSEEIEKMDRRLKALSAISVLEPMLGLLGTVTGIMSAFGAISRLGGQIDVSALAGGMWEALITTAAGLVVAIPFQLAYLYFEKLVELRENRMSYTITYLNEAFFEKSRGDESQTVEFTGPESPYRAYAGKVPGGGC